MLGNLQQIPLDPIFELLDEYQKDTNPQKVNLGIGLYADESGDPFVFPSIKKAMAEVDLDNFNYQPIGGNVSFLEQLTGLVLGSGTDLGNLAMVATCGGTQACRLFADLMAKDQEKRSILLGTPTWGNHFAVFAGLPIINFDHLTDDYEINMDSYRETLKNAANGSILILHGGLTHNPSGRGLTIEMLEELIPTLSEKEMVVFIDAAYLGFGDGFEADCEYVRLFFRELDNVACGISLSKNASLYEHRTGALVVKTSKKKVIESQLQQLLRESISMAPGLGQELMLNILNNNCEDWLSELEDVRQSIERRKSLLIGNLPPLFAKLQETRGLFGFLPLTPEQITRLKRDYSVYLPSNTRINYGGIKITELDYLIEAIKQVI